MLVGKLGAVDGNILTLEDGAKTYPVPLDDVVVGPARLRVRPDAQAGHVSAKKKKKRKT